MNELALDADRLILTGGIVYHLIAGFGGGRKAILPGISSYQTILKKPQSLLVGRDWWRYET